MKVLIIVALAVIAGFVLEGFLVSGTGDHGRAEAAQTTTKKKTTKKKTTAPKKLYCGYPAPPLPVGMSDYCAREYDLFCRRGVGCNNFGR